MGFARHVAGLGHAAAVRDRDHCKCMARAAESIAGHVRCVYRGAGRAANRRVLDQGREATMEMGQE